MFPVRVRSSFAIPGRARGTSAEAIRAVARALEMRSFAIDRITEDEVAFTSRRHPLLRWNWETDPLITGGAVRVVEIEGGYRVDYRLAFDQLAFIYLGIPGACGAFAAWKHASEGLGTAAAWFLGFLGAGLAALSIAAFRADLAFATSLRGILRKTG